MTKVKNKTKEEVSFTKEEIKTILECLLFSSSVDVCASWYKEDTDKMLSLAEKIRLNNPKVLLENIYISRFSEDDEMFSDKYSEKIITLFPEIEQLEKENV